MKAWIAWFLANSLALTTATAAQDVKLCGIKRVSIAGDGRLLNHLPYPAAPRTDLIRPRSFSGQCQGVHRDMLADLNALLARARDDPQVGRLIIAMSCFRSQRYQAGIFCRHGSSMAATAYEVAPPGFSEHETGLAIDFGDRRGGRCNLESCFASTTVGRWLAKNAPDFGFEMSFPQGNVQGVAFEPWHWRWVGRDEASRTLKSHAVFATAREKFPVSTAFAEPATRAELASITPFAAPMTSRILLASANLNAALPAHGEAVAAVQRDPPASLSSPMAQGPN